MRSLHWSLGLNQKCCVPRPAATSAISGLPLRICTAGRARITRLQKFPPAAAWAPGAAWMYNLFHCILWILIAAFLDQSLDSTLIWNSYCTLEYPNYSNFNCCLFVLSQGNATSVFLRNFQQVMYNLLITNPPWLAPNTVKKYFAQVFQCPRCKAGLWPFLETAIR